VRTSTEGRSSAVVWQWVARAVACFFLIVGSLVFVAFLDTDRPVWLVLAITGVGGALLYIGGLEPTAHPLSKWMQLTGWLLMAIFSLIPTSLLSVPAITVLLALPALLRRFPRP
jgi:hypothetical protein